MCSHEYLGEPAFVGLPFFKHKVIPKGHDNAHMSNAAVVASASTTAAQVALPGCTLSVMQGFCFRSSVWRRWLPCKYCELPFMISAL